MCEGQKWKLCGLHTKTKRGNAIKCRTIIGYSIYSIMNVMKSILTTITNASKKLKLIFPWVNHQSESTLWWWQIWIHDLFLHYQWFVNFCFLAFNSINCVNINLHEDFFVLKLKSLIQHTKILMVSFPLSLSLSKIKTTTIFLIIVMLIYVKLNNIRFQNYLLIAI